MTKVQRIENFFVALLFLLMAALLVGFPDYGYLLAFALITLSWIIKATKLLLFYFTMARFMVGGERVLLKGVIFFDLAILMHAVSDMPKLYVMLYLVLGMIFVNLVDVLRALDKKKTGASDWKYKMAVAVIGLIIAIVCLCNYRQPRLSGYIYAVELVYWAMIRFYNSFKKEGLVIE